MTIQPMVRACLLLFVALFLTACAADEPPVTEEGPDETTSAALADLEERIEELEGDLAEADEARERGRDELKAVRTRFRDSLKELRGSLAEVRATSSDASSEVSSALAEARAVAADLEVLEERYNYHLRRYHGGG